MVGNSTQQVLSLTQELNRAKRQGANWMAQRSLVVQLTELAKNHWTELSPAARAVLQAAIESPQSLIFDVKTLLATLKALWNVFQAVQTPTPEFADYIQSCVEFRRVVFNQLEQQDTNFQNELRLETTKAIGEIKTGQGVTPYATREDFEVMLHNRLRAHTDKISKQP